MKPVIAAINGAAVGVGATMTLPMDMRLASERAVWLCVRAARHRAGGGVVVFSAAPRWHFDGAGMDDDRAHVSGGEAQERGLVRSLHAPEDLLPAAYALAREIADNTSPVSVRAGAADDVGDARRRHPMAAHRMESRLMVARGAAADAAEGVTSFPGKAPGAISAEGVEGFAERIAAAYARSSKASAGTG